MVKTNLVKAEDMICRPRPGSAIDEGIKFGIDFSLNLKKLSLSVEERLRELQRAMVEIEQIRGIGLKNRLKKAVK